jgi:putative thioredoxin
MSTPSAEKSPWIIDTSDETFERDVFERSREVPVVVDFWSRTCQPCLMLAPILEEFSREYDGRFVLAKAHIEQAQGRAMEFRVQGVPAVFAVAGGETVDFFEGLLPPEHIRRWLDRVLYASDMYEAQQLEQTDPAEADRRYREVLAKSPNESAASIGLTRALLAQGRTDECRAELEKLEQRGFLEPEAEKIKAALAIEQSGNVNLDEVRAAADADPDDLCKRHALAEALAADKQFQEALDLCLELVQRDRRGIGEVARQTMVNIFRVLPDDSELTGTYRRKLASALY